MVPPTIWIVAGLRDQNDVSMVLQVAAGISTSDIEFIQVLESSSTGHMFQVFVLQHAETHADEHTANSEVGGLDDWV